MLHGGDRKICRPDRDQNIAVYLTVALCLALDEAEQDVHECTYQ